MKKFIPFLILIFSACNGPVRGQTSPSPESEVARPELDKIKKPAPTPSNPTGKKELTIIATTDFHGQLLPDTATTPAGKVVEIGGAALMSSYIKTIQSKAGAETLLLDGGDLFQGTMESNLFEGAPVVQYYNYMGYTAAALGNHEFDFGPVGPDAIPLHPGEDPVGALKERIKEAKFPILSANVKEDGKTPDWLKPSIVVEKNGIKVGVIGLSTPTTPQTTKADNVVGLTFSDPADAVISEAKKLKDESKVDVIVVTFHGGADCKSNDFSKLDDISSCDNGEVIKLAKRLPVGLVQFIVAGHTHLGVIKKINGALIIEAYSHAKYVGWAKVSVTTGAAPEVDLGGFSPVCGQTVKTEAGKYTCDPKSITSTKGDVYPSIFLGETIQPDAEVTKLIQPAVEKVRAAKERPLNVKVTDTFTRDYAKESSLGNLVADAMRAFVKDTQYEADVAVTNGGGLRDNIDKGDLKYGDVFNVLPFDNQLALITVNGDALLKMVAMGTRPGHGALSWSGLIFNKCNGNFEIEVNGEPLESLKNYKVLANDYLATGGSGFDELKLTPNDYVIPQDNQYIQREAVSSAIEKWAKPLSPLDFYNATEPRQKFCLKITGM